MASLSELARLHTTLDRDDIAHLQRLVGEWGMLADFCFADLLLYTPSRDGRWLVVGQVRPVTSQTLYLSDWVGAWANESERPVLAKAVGRCHHRGRGDGRGLARPGPHGGHPGASRRPRRRRAHQGVVTAGRPPAGRAGAHLPRHLPALRRHDRRRLVPLRGRAVERHRQPPRRRRRDGPRRRCPGHLRLAERRLGPPPRRHQRQRHRPAPGRARVPRRRRPARLRAGPAGVGGVRPDRRAHAGHALHPASWPAPR